MARRRTKKRSRKNTESVDKTEGLHFANRVGEPASNESVSNETPTVEAEKVKRSVGAADTDQAHADRVAETLANVERLLNQANDNASSDAPAWPRLLESSLEKTQHQLSSQLEQFTKCFEDRFNELQRTISERLDSKAIARINDQKTDRSSSELAADVSGEPESDWERRKREMYADLGEDSPASKDVANEAESATKMDAVEPNNDGDELASLQESLHDSIESLDEVQAEEIDELRAQLTEKLREAEVELSINRAKLDQGKAELERRQTELDRREKSLNSKYANVNGTPQKKGVLDRLTRHLGARKQADLL